MITFSDITILSPIPIVNLQAIELPSDGVAMACNPTCKRNWKKGNKCRSFYETLASASVQQEHIFQCPFGFSAVVVHTLGYDVALTGFIPFPRMGGQAEHEIAKKHHESHISRDGVNRIVRALAEWTERLGTLERAVVKGYSKGLHEIRKLNRTIKQTSERLMNADYSDQPLDRDELLKINKSSEMMSDQFEIIELLANDTSTLLPLNVESDVYRTFDKCVRIYGQGRVSLSRGTYDAKVLANDRTFPIIATVLITNAVKYSVPESPIHIRILQHTTYCTVEIDNLMPLGTVLSPKIFDEGYRASGDSEGTGAGLHLAQLIARQHGTRIKLRQDNEGSFSKSYSV